MKLVATFQGLTVEPTKQFHTARFMLRGEHVSGELSVKYSTALVELDHETEATIDFPHVTGLSEPEQEYGNAVFDMNDTDDEGVIISLDEYSEYQALKAASLRAALPGGADNSAASKVQPTEEPAKKPEHHDKEKKEQDHAKKGHAKPHGEK